jgi:hypothetical protein
MPEPHDTLSIFAEVAIALAGFSGIVIAFGRRSIGSLSTLEFRRLSNLFTLSGMALLFSPYVGADCIDIAGIENELPSGFTTKGNVQISYQYKLEKNEFSLSWRLGERSEGPFGPFPLTMSCGIPSLKWENANFLLFERGCGTFCWYVKAFSLATQEEYQTPMYQRIDRPLAFDSKRNLLAYYHSQNVIHLKNLVSGYEQEVITIH